MYVDSIGVAVVTIFRLCRVFFSLERVWNKGLELSFFSLLFFLFSVILRNGSGPGGEGLGFFCPRRYNFYHELITGIMSNGPRTQILDGG